MIRSDFHWCIFGEEQPEKDDFKNDVLFINTDGDAYIGSYQQDGSFIPIFKVCPINTDLHLCPYFRSPSITGQIIGINHPIFLPQVDWRWTYIPDIWEAFKDYEAVK